MVIHNFHVMSVDAFRKPTTGGKLALEQPRPLLFRCRVTRQFFRLISIATLGVPQLPAVDARGGCAAFSFERSHFVHYDCCMTASSVIEEIKQLPRTEQSRVIRFAFELARERQMAGKKLSDL